MIKSRLSALFDPRSIAVIGVSEHTEGVGRRVFDNIRRGGFGGRVFAVNAKHASVAGVATYPSVTAIGEPIDVAVVAVPAAQVPDIVRECGQAGVRFAVVLSAGFAETGTAGAALQAQLVESARAAGVRVLGPNCLGFMRSPSALNASFSAGIGHRGKLALVSQSGAVCSAILDWAEARHIGFSTVVSLGAAADVSIGEVLDELALDPETEAILLYVEGVDHARSFMSGLRAAARIKPVVVVKAGRHEHAGRAVASHTGAVVGNAMVFDAAVRRAGAVRVDELQQLFSAAEALSHATHAMGDRLAIVTNAGGLGVLAVDRAEELGVKLAVLSEATRSALGELLPAHASRDNPVDILGDAPPERYGQALDLCLRDPGVDGVVVLLSPQIMTRPDEVAAVIAAREGTSRVPILAAFVGGAQVEGARELLAHHDVSSFHSPEVAVEAFDTLVQYQRNQQQLLELPESPHSQVAPELTAARSIISGALDAGRSLLTQLESKALLEAFGIPCITAVRAADVTQAVAAAAKLGFPVALKVDSPDITHKRDIGGVKLGLADGAQVARAYEALMTAARTHAPAARITGVVVETMLQLPDSRELLVGLLRDPALGPAVALGMGGTLVELFGAPTVALPPLTVHLAQDMLHSLRFAPLLGAFRGMGAIDEHALQEVLLRVSDMACELPELKELDINPLIASPDGAVALDARVVVERVKPNGGPHAHLAIAPYPQRLVRTLQLADGTQATLRPVRPEDARIEKELISALSFRSRYFRFLRGVSQLSPQAIARLTQLDYDRELALVVTVSDATGEHAVGVARYVTEPDGQSCEFAIVLADALQRQGLGRALMHALIDAARAAGLPEMHGEVLVENYPMLGFVRQLGFEVQPHPEDPTLKHVTLALSKRAASE